MLLLQRVEVRLDGGGVHATGAGRAGNGGESRAGGAGITVASSYSLYRRREMMISEAECRFRCGSTAKVSDWGIQDIRIYNCPKCPVYGVSDILETVWDDHLGKKFLEMKDFFLDVAPKQKPDIGIFYTEGSNDALILQFFKAPRFLPRQNAVTRSGR